VGISRAPRNQSIQATTCLAPISRKFERCDASASEVGTSSVRLGAPLEGPEGLTSFVLANSRFGNVFEIRRVRAKCNRVSVDQISQRTDKQSRKAIRLGLTMKYRKAYQLLNDRSWRKAAGRKSLLLRGRADKPHRQIEVSV
jgi:hypothetical protein